MNFNFEKVFSLNPDELFKISSLQIELYLPPEDDVEFSTSICINHPKHAIKQAKIIQLPSIENKNLYLSQMSQKNMMEKQTKKEISIASIWIKARFLIFS